MHNILFYINIFTIMLNKCMLWEQLVPNLLLLFLLTYFVFWIKTIVFCYKLVLRILKVTVKEIDCISLSTGDSTWHLGHSTNASTLPEQALCNCLSWKNKLHRCSSVCLVDFLPVLHFLCEFLSFSFISTPPTPCLCWRCHHVNRRPSNL